MKDKGKKEGRIDINLSDAILVVGIVTMIILFAGQPDLWDVILYKISDGQVPIPMIK